MNQDTFSQGFPAIGGGSDPRSIIEDACMSATLPSGIVIPAGVIGYSSARKVRTLNNGVIYKTPTLPFTNCYTLQWDFEFSNGKNGAGTGVTLRMVDETTGNHMRLSYQTDGNIVFYNHCGGSDHVVWAGGSGENFSGQWRVQYSVSDNLNDTIGPRASFSIKQTFVETTVLNANWGSTYGAGTTQTTNMNAIVVNSFQVGDNLHWEFECDGSPTVYLYRFHMCYGSLQGGG